MKFTEKEKNIGKGATIGLVIGACLGVPIIGATAGGLIANDKNNKKRKK